MSRSIRRGFSEGMRKAVEDLRDPIKGPEIQKRVEATRLETRLRMAELYRGCAVIFNRLRHQRFRG